MKTVGVVIPIYNVEKYLKECLDSVINQTYTNLEIILVNDGSTDENSLNIAKEYTLKDKRITLFDKKNGGQSTARNVGIEYFSGEYKLKNKTQTIKENSLIEFNIEGNNPYEIYTVYKSYKAFNNEQDLTNLTYPIIDYIIFLDSDDYWELNCIEECVPRMDGVDVLWFKEKILNETNLDINTQTIFEKYYLKNIITNTEWIEIQSKKDNFFQFVCFGMINFALLKKIKLSFKDNIIGEDRVFGILLFLQCNKIYMLDLELYFYRIRENSTCNYTNTGDSFSRYHLQLFSGGKNIKRHIRIYSHIKILLALIKYCKKSNNQAGIEICRKIFIPSFYNSIKKDYLKCEKVNTRYKYIFINLDKHWIEFCGNKSKNLFFLKNKFLFNFFILCYTIIFRFKLPKR
ncbi:glycosyltransferase family 2 protein [Campylobacter lari]|nr:glycosyltransferase family 2 protein [Campylobacter lari]